MGKKCIPRNLELRINQLANERVQRSTSLIEYRKAYLEEKARLLCQVVTQLASGKTSDEIFAELPTIRDSENSKKLAAINALRKEIMKML